MGKTATFETNVGPITAELYETDAPLAVANFEKLANSAFYDGVKFHRVIPEFVVSKWYHHALHNQTALRLKGSLLFREGIVVISVPYIVGAEADEVARGDSRPT